MDKAQKVIVPGHTFPRLQPIYPVDFVRPVQTVRHNVPGPTAQVSDLLCLGQMGFARTQWGFGRGQFLRLRRQLLSRDRNSSDRVWRRAFASSNCVLVRESLLLPLMVP